MNAGRLRFAFSKRHSIRSRQNANIRMLVAISSSFSLGKYFFLK